MISVGSNNSQTGEMKMFSCAVLRLKFRVSHTYIYPEPGTLLEGTVLQLIP